MKLTISGVAGSGKSTVAKIIAEKLNLQHYSMGDLMRQIAKEKGISLEELGRQAEQDESIDKELDQKQIALKEKDNFIIDGRLTAHFIPDADLKVFLDCDDAIRAERILKDSRQDENGATVGETLDNIKKREESERKRYKEIYDVDYKDGSLYDLIVDTSKLTVDEVVEKIIAVVK